MIISIVVIAFLLLGNGFFVGAEFAIIAARRTQLEPLAAAGSKRAGLALRAMGQVPLMIAGAQLGITVCSLALGALAEPALAHLLEAPFKALNMPDAALHPTAFAIALAIVVYLHTVVGEMVPKNIALAGPEKAVLWLGPPMWWFCTATKPLLVAMKWLSRMLLRLWGIRASDEVKTVYTAQELASLVGQSHTEGLLDAHDHRRITGALTLTSRNAASVMRPWRTVYTVPADVTPAELEELAVRTRRSRYPVIDPSSRTIQGFVHAKEVLHVPAEHRDRPLTPEAIRPLALAGPHTPLADLLIRMRRERSHIALISNGQAPLGIVSLEDILTAVVGLS